MNQDSSHAGESGDSKSLFQATQWNLILSIAQGDTAHAGPAREEFCRTYRHAVYGVVRARGKSKEEAEDLTQDFFLSHLLIKNAFKSLDPKKGRFRNFLMTALRNFLTNHYDHQNAKKRSPGKPLISLEDAEEKYLTGTKAGWTEDMVFDRQWALAIVARALARLRQLYEAKGKAEQFEAFKKYLTTEPTDGEYDALAARFGMQNKAVAMAISRLKPQYRRLAREELEHTLTDQQDLEEEWRYLLEVLSR